MFLLKYNKIITNYDKFSLRYSIHDDLNYTHHDFHAYKKMTRIYDNVYEMTIDVNSNTYCGYIKNVSSMFEIIVINSRYYTLTIALYEWLNDSTLEKIFL